MQAVTTPPSSAVKERNAVNIGLKVLVVALAAAFMGVIGWNLRDTTVHEGDRAPVFSIHSDQGHTITPDHFEGKILVLNFWASWCPPCVSETPSLNAFARKYKDRGVVVLGISIDKNPEKYQRFIKRFQVPFDTFRDPGSTISARYGTFQIPETYVIKNGRVMRKYISDQNWMSGEIDRYIESLL
ncbi:MAG TPA: TlpA disulfide reductase family protein [Bryobacteraceae bacterium]|jgi:peroxiredoxin